MEMTPLVKSIRNFMSCLTLKLYLNLLEYNGNIIGYFSKFVGSLRLSLDMFPRPIHTFRRIFAKWLKIFLNRQKLRYQYVLHQKK